ncbi:MAG: hypothetical protein C4K58_01235 [Flavobacteriaceae bacterium]|nr:MAG: hypothetical protein C4K58_01235 [Flavobacteriaceae bacterium]
METLIDKIVANPKLHSKWLNSLSMMENVGAKKIKNCEDPVFVSEMILKHASEEARHAYFLKKQIVKIEENACPTYEKQYLIRHRSFYFYSEIQFPPNWNGCIFFLLPFLSILWLN